MKTALLVCPLPPSICLSIFLCNHLSVCSNIQYALIMSLLKFSISSHTSLPLPLQFSLQLPSSLASSPISSSSLLSTPLLISTLLSCILLSCPLLSCPLLSCPIHYCPVLYYPVLYFPVLYCPILYYPVLLFI